MPQHWTHPPTRDYLVGFLDGVNYSGGPRVQLAKQILELWPKVTPAEEDAVMLLQRVSQAYLREVKVLHRCGDDYCSTCNDQTHKAFEPIVAVILGPR